MKISPVIDTGMNKTLICEKDWKRMVKADPLLKAKRCRVKFTPYDTEMDLPSSRQLPSADVQTH